MQSILKWIFGSKEEEHPFEVDFSNLSEWLWKFIEGEISRDIAQYGILLASLKESIAALEKLNVEKENVEKKLKELVRGNKPAYANSLNILIKKIEPPQKLSSKQLEEFCKNVENAIDDFGKRSVRNYAVLKTIIGKELADIINILKQIESLELSLKEKYLKSSRLKAIEDLRRRLAFFYEFEASREKKSAELKKLIHKKEAVSMEINNIKAKIEELRKSDSFIGYEEINLQKSSLGAEELKLKGKASAIFSELSRPLKKMDKSNERISKYCDNPYAALIEDTDLEILGFISELNKKLESGKIVVKNKKKLMKEIVDYSQNIKKISERAHQISKDMKSLHSKLSSNTFQKEEKELTYRFQSLENELSDTISEIDSLKEQGKDFNLMKISGDIEKIVGRKVIIKNAPVM